MSALAQPLAPDDAPVHDHIVRLCGATWADYQRLLEIRGDHSAPRIAYLEGQIEIMSPSVSHEAIKSTLGRLVEAFCSHHGIEFQTVGSWTLEDKAAERGAEPDESWIFGEEKAERPHLAIEVVWTSGGLNKLQIYRKLGVREVWIWRKGRLDAHVLAGEDYVQAPRSEVLPGIDLAEVASFVDRPTTSRSVREYTAALRAKG